MLKFVVIKRIFVEDSIIFEERQENFFEVFYVYRFVIDKDMYVFIFYLFICKYRSLNIFVLFLNVSVNVFMQVNVCL